jgi:quercetin 2,3-dioxygenase
MLKVRQAQERGSTKIDWLDSKHTFSFADYYDAKNTHFGALRVINEDIVSPSAGFGKHFHKDMEILTYVLSGQLEHKDSMGNGSTIEPGMIQRMSAGTGVTHSEWNHSSTEPVHFLQIWVLPEKQDLTPSYEEKNISAPASGNWQILASNQKNSGGVYLHQDMDLRHGKVSSQSQLKLPIENDRMAWLQVLSGSCLVNDLQLKQGDGLAVDEQGELNLTTPLNARVLWFNLRK